MTRQFPRNGLTRRNILAGPHVREPLEVDWVSGASMMIRRAAFDAVGGMDERFFLSGKTPTFASVSAMPAWPPSTIRDHP